MKKILLLIGITVVTSVSISYAPEAEAGRCNSIKTPDYKKEDLCKVMDFTDDVSDSKYFYKNPNTEGCDLGFKMPGLPDFGFSIDAIGKFDLCSALQHVTEDVVADINSYTQGAVDEAVNSATGGLGTQIHIDPNAAINSTLTGGTPSFNGAVQTGTGPSRSANTQKLLDVLKNYSNTSPSQ